MLVRSKHNNKLIVNGYNGLHPDELQVYLGTSAVFKLLYQVWMISCNTPRHSTPPPQSCALRPLPACGEGIKGWGSWGIMSDLPNLILRVPHSMGTAITVNH